MRALVLCLFAVSGTPVHAGGAGLTVHNLSTRDGLPQNTILDIAQSPDGTLHLATFGGVVRFDGASFEVQDVGTHPALGTSRIECVSVDSSGRRYVGTSEGRVLREDPTGWTRIELPKADLRSIRGLVVGPDDELWIATRGGLFVLPADAELASAVGDGFYRDLALGLGGEVYSASDDGVSLHEGMTRSTLATFATDALAVGSDGTLYASADDVVFRRSGDEWERLDVRAGRVSDLLVDRSGRLWVTGTESVGFWSSEHASWIDTAGDLGLELVEPLTRLFEDRDENLWIGTHTHGVFQVYESPLSLVSSPLDGLGQIVAVVADLDGEVYALGKELWVLRDGALVAATTPRPTAIARARSGGMWLETPGGIERFEHGRRSLVVPAEELPRGRGKLLEATDGSLWIERRGTLARWKDGGLETHDLGALGADKIVSALFEDGAGRIWVGGLSSLLRLDGESSELYRSGEGLPLGELRAFYEEAGGALWVGTYGGGICRISEEGIAILDTSRGLHENVASTLVPDGRGHLVVMGNRALARYRIDDLVAAARDESRTVHGRVFDSGPGVTLFEGNGYTQPRWAVGPDGVMWFPTLRGLARFAPGHVDGRVRIPEPRVSVRVREPIELEEVADHTPRFVLRPEAREAQVRFSAADFTRPRQVHFRYRLMGRSEGWETPANVEVVTFTDLPPGDYRFEIEAAVGDGPFGNRNSSVRFHVPPRAWERAWVQGIALALALGAVAGLAFLRVRSARTRSRELAKTVATRTRELANEVEERKRVELELRRAGEELEAQVELRTEELVEALDNLERDMRRREELEGRLRESEKLEAIGRLAGGLAHDFNNILTSVIGESDLGLAKLSADRGEGELEQRLKRHLEQVREAGLRAARLTRQLLAYSRQQVMVPQIVDPLRTVRELEPMLRRLVPENIPIELAAESESVLVRIDPGQLEHVLVNLVVNAAEAMPSGGCITISYSVETRDSDGRWCVLRVADRGPDLDDAQRSRLFEPFASKPGSNRGLGLASVEGIVVQSDGTLTVERTPGGGTTFVVALPEASGSLSEPSPPPALPRAGLTALLVDDDEDVRAVVRSMLEERGVRVLETSDPRSALELARERASELDILVSDAVMPEMNGRDLVEAVREVCPELGVLFISGYSREVLRERDLVDSRTEVLAKPFDGAALFERVARLAK